MVKYKQAILWIEASIVVWKTLWTDWALLNSSVDGRRGVKKSIGSHR